MTTVLLIKTAIITGIMSLADQYEPPVHMWYKQIRVPNNEKLHEEDVSNDRDETKAEPEVF